MLIERNEVTGAITISQLIGEHLVTKAYFGYTKKEAIQEFMNETREQVPESSEAEG